MRGPLVLPRKGLNARCVKRYLFFLVSAALQPHRTLNFELEPSEASEISIFYVKIGRTIDEGPSLEASQLRCCLLSADLSCLMRGHCALFMMSCHLHRG